MRKLKLQVQMTIDGFIAGSNGEMDWMKFLWTEDLIQYVTELTDSMDCIVLGRKLAEGFIPHWAAVASNENDPEHAAGKIFTDTNKIVFTKTLEQSNPIVMGWNNTVVNAGNLVDEINTLKNKSGKDIIAYGGAQFVSSLIKENLIDELHLFINPAIIGKGMTIFHAITEKRSYEVINAQSFDCGIVVLTYKPL